MELGYHVLLEKPMSNNEAQCRQIVDAANRTGRTLAVCHVLRYTPFYMTLKHLIDQGRIGEVTTINQIENVGYWHQAHSFVRGNWRNTAETSPMILQKSCHDMDIILWLMDKTCKRVQSFGSLRHFTPENAPEGAPERCLDGCPHADTCPYYAPRLYMDMNRTGWPVDVITTDLSEAGRRKALEEGPYGRCVYACDNDVVDSQVVNMEMEDGVLCQLMMTAFCEHGGRSIRVMGTRGCIEGDMDRNVITVKPFGLPARVIDINLAERDLAGHGGGDGAMVAEVIRMLGETGKPTPRMTTLEASCESHYIAFAAEKSRLSGGAAVELSEVRGVPAKD